MTEIKKEQSSAGRQCGWLWSESEVEERNRGLRGLYRGEVYFRIGKQGSRMGMLSQEGAVSTGGSSRATIVSGTTSWEVIHKHMAIILRAGASMRRHVLEARTTTVRASAGCDQPQGKASCLAVFDQAITLGLSS